MATGKGKINLKLSYDQLIFRRSLLFAVSFALLLWLVRAVEWGTTSDFGAFGILPRHATGMVGIITGPLIHGNFIHLLSNTFPLLMLMVAVFYFYEKIALEVFIWIYLITGAWVWIAAREAYHIGASGLVYGLGAFLFFSGIFRRDARSIAVAVAIAFLYSGMIQGVLPGADATVSWESHLLGAAAGVFCAFYFRSKRIALGSSVALGEIVRKEGAVSHTFHRYPFHTGTSFGSSFKDEQSPVSFERYVFKKKDKSGE